jgi:hypothetical protein
MKRHATDTVSLVFGIIFLAMVRLWLVGRSINIEVPHFGWVLALGLIVLGLIGVVASLRRSEPGQPATEPRPTTQPLREGDEPSLETADFDAPEARDR